MLAWVHAAMASEQELLVSLFGGDSAEAGAAALRAASGGALAGGGGAPLSPRASAGGEGGLAGGADGAPTIPQLLDQVFESICRPLKASRAGAVAAVGGDTAAAGPREAQGHAHATHTAPRPGRLPQPPAAAAARSAASRGCHARPRRAQTGSGSQGSCYVITQPV